LALLAAFSHRSCDDLECIHSKRLANELLGVVLSGRKRATSELVADFVARGDQVPRIGSHWIACDGEGLPRIIIRSTELRIGRIASADTAFARDEGEDDLTLEGWQREHRRYWTRVSAAGREWSEDDEIVFERFKVVWPPEHEGGARAATVKVRGCMTRRTARCQLRPREELPPRAHPLPAYEPSRSAGVHVCAGRLPRSKRQAEFRAKVAQ
jgi:uncharacterized protein YhfF